MDRVEEIQKIGAKVNFEYEYRGEAGTPERQKYDLPDKVASVSFPLTPEEWCDVGMVEGDSYVGGCCGNMSALQDLVEGIFRDSGYAEAQTLLDMAYHARDHEGFEWWVARDDEKFVEGVARIQELREQGARLDAWAVMGITFLAVEDRLTPRSQGVPSDGGRHDEEQTLIWRLTSTLTRMTWADLFTRRDETDVAQHTATRELLKAKTLPLARRLTELLHEEGVGLEGYAIVKQGTDEVLGDNHGLCLYATEAAADSTMALWAKWAEEERERIAKNPDRESEAFWNDRKAEVVPARVSVEDGLVLRP